MNTLLLRNGRLVGDHAVTPRDVLIREGRVAALLPAMSGVRADEEIDLGGLYLSAGFIDIHVHGAAAMILWTARPRRITARARCICAMA